jgi:hypothetical protein
MKCKFVKPDGTQCNANAMTNSDYCYFHNPDISDEEKREATARGGQARAVLIKEPLKEMPIKKIPDVALLLVQTINLVRAGKMDIRTANCLGFLSDKLIKALDTGELQTKFEEVEQMLEELKRNNNLK